jgi:uroporphyrinogen decarboxylase
MTDPRPKPLIAALSGETQARPPFWLMRQAGRYLPEYRALRAKAGSFLDLCLNPAMASEVTLQPVRRFGMDGAILFSDILIVPFGLGQPLAFKEGEGPVLDPIRDRDGIERLDFSRFQDRVGPVYETVRLTRAALPDGVAMIGFAGSPWTVASYMIEGGSSRDYTRIKSWAFQRPGDLQHLFDRLIEATAFYLGHQIEAGAEVVQLFDSWAGVLAPDEFERWVTIPNQTLTRRLKDRYPDVPVIAFPRGAGLNFPAFADAVPADAFGLDTTVPPAWARDHLQGSRAVQGNLDPLALVAGGETLRRAATAILDTLAGGPFVFNLGHGIVPQTPPEHVGLLAELIRGYQR